ncbi:MAG: tRNA pseudouridine(55) synthase TruB [Lachnospiraceae bacterium]|nr:tRNA pseudouridine(55) synthase TruB [Lachnospiraceae bacterium]
MDGIINIYKEKGFTSHDVVAKLRGILRQRKIGHTGTLDPDAEGVLPVCLGRATKVCELLTDWDKEYRTVLLLGRTTDTQDMTGTVLRECPVFCASASDSSGSDESVLRLTEEGIRHCIESFVGEQQQIPPMYSALKVNGKKLYELARQGIEEERRPRTITIPEIRVERIDCGGKQAPGYPEITMTVRCSKGTYIRTLCNDIGEKLGCGGCMKELVRTQVGPFSIEDSRKLSEVEGLRDENRLDEVLYPIDSVFHNLEWLVLTPDAERLVRNGNPLSHGMVRSCADYSKNRFQAQEPERSFSAASMKGIDGNEVRIYTENGEFLAIYGYRKDKSCWRPVKMFLP